MGFKEVRLHAGRSDDLFDDAVEVSRAAANIKIRAQAETFKLIASAQTYMYLLLAAVVFVAPTFSDSLSNGAITKTTTALLFIIGACFGLVQSIPVLLNANSAADRLAKLETDFRASDLDRSRTGQGAEAFRQDRNAQRGVPLQRRRLRHDL